MSAPSRPVIVKFRTPMDIVGAMPSVVGFHPRESLVLMCLRGPRKRQGLTMRVDLPDPRHHHALVTDLAPRAAKDKATAAILVCYTEADDVGDRLPRAELVELQIEHLRRRGIGLAEALLVRDGRWYSYTCTQDCCPPEGSPIPDTPTSAAALFASERALIGRAVLPDRESLERTVRGPVALRLIALEQTFDRVGPTIADELMSEGRDAVRSRTIALARDAFGRYVEGRRDLDDADAARIVLGLHDKLARDELTTWAIDGETDELIVFLSDLAQRTPDLDAAPICTVLAAAAYQAGNGALAGIALERALRANPAYEMAQLYSTALAGQIPPATLRALFRDVRRELRRRAS